MVLLKQYCTIFRINEVLLIAPVPFVLGIINDLSASEGSGDKFKCVRHLFNAFNMESLTAISRSLLPLPTTVNHQLPSLSFRKSFMCGVHRLLAANSEIRKYIKYSDDRINKVRSYLSAFSFASISAVSITYSHCNSLKRLILGLL